jgi:hypothetical protein
MRDVFAHGLRVQIAVLAEIENVKATRVCAEEECLWREDMQDSGTVGSVRGTVSRRKADLGDDQTSLRREVLDHSVCTGRVES